MSIINLLTFNSQYVCADDLRKSFKSSSQSSVADFSSDYELFPWYELDPQVKETWWERVQWLRLVKSLVTSDLGSERYHKFKQEWKNFVGGRGFDRQSEFSSMFQRMHQLWLDPLPDWSTLKAFDNYVEASESYYQPGLVIATVAEHDQLLARFSGSQFQLLPFASKRYWGEINALGVLDAAYNNTINLAADGRTLRCYFPIELLERYGLAREQFLDGSYSERTEYDEFMHYWLNVHLAQLKFRIQPLFVAITLHQSWVVLLKWMLARYNRIELLLHAAVRSTYSSSQLNKIK